MQKKGQWCVDLRELNVLPNDKATVKQSLTVENQQQIAIAERYIDGCINAIEERYIDGCDVYVDWKFMGQTAREYLVPTKVNNDINYEKK